MPPASHPELKRCCRRACRMPRVRSAETVRSSSMRLGSCSRESACAIDTSLSSHSRSFSISSDDLLIPYLSCRLEQRTHVAARMKELAFGRARRDSELLRNLFVAVAFDIVQHEY